MCSTIVSSFDRTILRYIFIGGIAYVTEMTSLLLLSLSGMGDILTVSISFWIGLAISFILQKILTFNDKKADTRSLVRQAILYGILVLFNYFFTLAFVWISAPALGLLGSRTCAAVITTIWNYLIYKYLIFKS